MRHSTMDRRMALLAAGVAATAALIACGGGDDDGGTPTADPSTARATATRPAASPTSPAAQPSPIATPTAAAVATVSVPAPVENTPAAPPPAQNTAAPPPPPPPANTPAPPPGGNVSVYIKAVTTAFSPSTATVPAGAPVSLTFDNQDPGIMHDLVLYGAGSSVVAATDIATGPNTQTITFTLTAGEYVFKCSVHPREMNGALTAQ